MIRVGIFGAENSHAMAFSRLLNNPGSIYDDMRVVAIGGEEEEAARKIMDECGVEFLAKTPEDMLGRIDAAMITSRDGALHARYAKPFIEKGLPTFIDKPFTRDVAEAEALVALAKSHNAPIMGGSSVKLVPDAVAMADFAANAENGRLIGGDCWAPVSMHNAYGDFWFYSAHLAEMCIRIFGVPSETLALRNSDDVTVVARYGTYDVTLHYTEGAYTYGATVLMAKNCKTGIVDISDCYALELAGFAALAHGAPMHEEYEALVKPVRMMAAIARSLESGKAETL